MAETKRLFLALNVSTTALPMALGTNPIVLMNEAAISALLLGVMLCGVAAVDAGDGVLVDVAMVISLVALRDAESVVDSLMDSAVTME